MPFDWFSNLIGSDRNHFDRIAHFSVGFYAFAAAEWRYAVLEGGDAGIEFLRSQGDIWDAQKDMLADTLGALFALVLFAFVRSALSERRRAQRLP